MHAQATRELIFFQTLTIVFEIKMKRDFNAVYSRNSDACQYALFIQGVRLLSNYR